MKKKKKPTKKKTKTKTKERKPHSFKQSADNYVYVFYCKEG